MTISCRRFIIPNRNLQILVNNPIPKLVILANLKLRLFKRIFHVGHPFILSFFKVLKSQLPIRPPPLTLRMYPLL